MKTLFQSSNIIFICEQSEVFEASFETNKEASQLSFSSQSHKKKKHSFNRVLGNNTFNNEQQ